MSLQKTFPTHTPTKSHLSADMVRLIAPDGSYLHLSGKGTTRDVDYSWLGHRYQAQTLRRRAQITGTDWPFRMIHRRATDGTDLHAQEKF